jgi:TolB-like protein/tetratricopeptide (TPR) repeat protein
VAVLPFTNMSADPEQVYFCEGMAEEILNALSRIQGLRVAARSSAFQFDPKLNGAREVGEALKVKTVLEGSVRTAGTRVRVSVQLVDVENGFQLWSDRYDREMDDIFVLQDEISERVAEALVTTLGVDKGEEPGRPTESVDAYHLFLKGQHNWYKRERGALEKAASFFEQATLKDPAYALAHAGVMNAYSSMALYGLDPRVARARVDGAVKMALELAPEKAGIRAALGLKAAYLDWNWVAAEREFAAAIEANPSYVLAYCWQGIMLAWIGRGDEAVVIAEKARDMDPLSPYTNTSLGLALLSCNRREAALQALNESLDIDGDHLYSLWVMTSTLGALGRTSEAVLVAEKAALLSGRGGFYLGWLAWACGIDGQHDRVRSIIDELTSKAEGTYIQPFGLVLAYSGLGEIDSTFEWIERGIAVRDPLIADLTLPHMVALHDDPRWPSILERVVHNE